MITTPMHAACEISNEDAVWVLESHHYDPNILVNNISPLFSLLNTT